MTSFELCPVGTFCRPLARCIPRATCSGRATRCSNRRDIRNGSNIALGGKGGKGGNIRPPSLSGPLPSRARASGSRGSRLVGRLAVKRVMLLGQAVDQVVELLVQ